MIRVLEKFCPPQLLESIEGDLVEQFYADAELHGLSTAKRKFAWNVVRFFRFEILLRNRFTVKLINAIMVSNYFKVAVRNIQKRKMYSFINAFGLSIGIAFCMLIWLFIQDEFSFDRFHENKANLYRIDARSYNYWQKDIPEKDRWSKQAWLQVGLLSAIKDECPEVVAGTRFNKGTATMTVGDKIFIENFTYVEPDFLKMFSFKLLKGDVSSVLADKSNIVLTPEIARKYFGDEDSVGKTVLLDIDGNRSFTVTGVIEAPPANSSIDFTMLIRVELRPNFEQQMTKWGNFSTPCFVQLRADADTALFRKKLAGVRDKYMGPTIERWRNNDGAPRDKELIEYFPTPLVKIHLMKEVGWSKVSDIQYSYILGGIAGLILLIACINYIALALTTSAARRTEVGVRKVVGAVRKQLMYQFGLESIVLSMISLLVGIGLVVLFLPAFNEFTEKGISFNAANIWQFGLIGFLLALIVGILAGSYPSIFLARFKPATVLKGGFTTRLQAGFTRPLVVLQFSMSAFLIVSSVIMYRQMKFISTKDLGYNKDAVVVVPMQAGWNNKADVAYNQLRNELIQWPEVSNVAGASISFNDGYNRWGYKINDINYSAYVYAIDQNYIPTLGMTLVGGRNFDPAIATDSTAVIVNEALMKDMGWKELTDDTYLNWLEDSTSRGARVIGVVKNYNFRSLEAPVEPMLLSMYVKQAGHMENALIKVNSADMPSMITRLEETWHKLFPDKPFQYSFLDENVAKQYDRYEKRMSIMGISTGFAILISCLGLFGLAGINAVNRTKEVGIRKVMGADMKNIFILLNRQYVWLSLIAFALAMPFSWYVMDKWLSDFQYQVPIGWELFALSVVVGLAVAIITVSYHAIRVSLINPAETLKYE
ncbi:MAG: ABC transporter permease [Bacteroidota bacterium]